MKKIFITILAISSFINTAMAQELVVIQPGESVRVGSTRVRCQGGADESDSTANLCASINRMSDEEAFRTGMNGGFGRCYVFNNNGYYGIMDSSTGRQISDTYREEYWVGRGLKQLVCTGRCSF